EAIRLFLERARSAQSDFALTPRNVRAVSDVCTRLDGIPFAIELAASQLRVLSAAELARMLEHRFQLLKASHPDVPRRATLLATLQWSYDLLNAEEQAFLTALSTFAGGWTLGAATAICRDGGDEVATLDLVSRLVDKSLVSVERRDDESSRY